MGAVFGVGFLRTTAARSGCSTSSRGRVRRAHARDGRRVRRPPSRASCCRTTPRRTRVSENGGHKTARRRARERKRSRARARAPTPFPPQPPPPSFPPPLPPAPRPSPCLSGDPAHPASLRGGRSPTSHARACRAQPWRPGKDNPPPGFRSNITADTVSTHAPPPPYERALFWRPARAAALVVLGDRLVDLALRRAAARRAPAAAHREQRVRAAARPAEHRRDVAELDEPGVLVPRRHADVREQQALREERALEQRELAQHDPALALDAHDEQRERARAAEPHVGDVREARVRARDRVLVGEHVEARGEHSVELLDRERFARNSAHPRRPARSTVLARSASRPPRRRRRAPTMASRRACPLARVCVVAGSEFDSLARSGPRDSRPEVRTIDAQATCQTFPRRVIDAHLQQAC